MKKYMYKTLFALCVLSVFTLICMGIYSRFESKMIDIYLSGVAEEVEEYIDRYHLNVNSVLQLNKSIEDQELWRFIENDIESEWEDVMPIYLAAGNPDPDVLKLLFERGATFNPMGIASLDRALLTRKADNVRLLLDIFKERRGTPDAPNSLERVRKHALAVFFAHGGIEGDQKIILKDFIACQAFSNIPGREWDEVIEMMYPDFFIVLEENGVRLPQNISPLLATAAARGSLGLTRFFLQRGGDPNAVVTAMDQWGNYGNHSWVRVPVFSEAVIWNGTPEVIIALLEAGANLNALDSRGRTVLARLSDKIGAWIMENRMKSVVVKLELRRLILIQAGAHE